MTADKPLSAVAERCIDFGGDLMKRLGVVVVVVGKMGFE